MQVIFLHIFLLELSLLYSIESSMLVIFYYPANMQHQHLLAQIDLHLEAFH